MAKQEAGYYSPEAIQARQQKDVDAFNQQQEAKKKEKASPPVSIDVPKAEPTKLTIPTPKVLPTDNLPKAKPYLAYDVTSSGLAFYGNGLAGWLRKSWADLTDPQKYKQDINLLAPDVQEKVNSSYEGRVDSWSNFIEEKTKWSDWGEKMFGLKTEELAALPAGISTERQITQEMSKAEGDTDLEAKAQEVGTLAARMVRVGVDTVQNSLWGGLEILGLGDKGMRKVHTAVMGLDAVADEFDKDEASNIFAKLSQGNPISVAKDVYTVVNAMRDGKITFGEVKEEVKQYMQGSEMAYTMVFDEAMRAEFERGVAEGKDPLLLAQEYGRAGIELAGSILGDPTTYLGLSIIKPVNIFSKTGRLSAQTVRLFGKTVSLPWEVVGKIPSFGEIIGANIGKTRLANASMRFVNNSIPELETILKNAPNIESEREAAKVIDRAVTAVTTKFDDMRKHKQWWNLASVDSAGKVRRVSSDADYFIKASLARYGLNDTLQMMRDMVLLRQGGADSVEAAKRLIPRNGFVFSDVGMMVGEIVSRLDNDNLFDAIKKTSNFSEAHGELYKRLEGVISDFIPSVDEMLDAERKLKAGESSARLLELAEMAKDLPSVVRTVNKLTRPSEKLVRGTTAGMVQLFMNWVPRSWARNIYGQGIMTALYTDIPTAIATSIEAFGGSPVKKLADNIIEATDEKIVKILGFSPIEASKGIGDVLNPKKTRYGFLPAMQRSEQITASNIVLKTVETEIQKALPSVLKNMEEWDELMGVLPKEQQSVMNLALKRASGNIDEALNIFRDIAGNGEIQAWRVAEPPQNMRQHLLSINMLDEFYEVQRKAQSVEEFQTFVKQFTDGYTATVTKAAESLPSTVTKMPEGLYDFGEDLGKIADPGQQKIVGELIQSWQNTLEQLDNTVHGVLTFARRQTQGLPEFAEVEKATNAIHDLTNLPAEQYQSINILREEMHRIKKMVQNNDNKNELIDLWNQDITYRGKKFNLGKIYPDQDLSKMDSKVFQKRMWTAFFETASDVYRNGNNLIYSRTLDALEEMAGRLGLTLDELAARPGGDNPFNVLTKMYKQSEEIEDAVSWRRFLNQFNFEQVPTKSDGTPVLLKEVIGKFEETFKSWKGGQKHIVNAVIKDTGKNIPYEQITLQQAYRAIWKRTRIPPDDGTINDARILWETKDEFLADIKRWSDSVVNDWGVKVKTANIDSSQQLRKFIPAFEKRMKPVREMAGRVAVDTRDFVLHDYDKTYMDHALSNLFGNSFHYWTTRTYAKSIETLLDNPSIGTKYLAYKEYMTKEHANMPEFYRQNVTVQNLLGMDLSSPYYLNLEAMINPIYGLTGTDFNDPRKKVDWVSRLIDDTGKMGPSFSPLISWAVATHLYMKGEEGAAQRWLGRLLPQSQVFKSGTAWMFNKAIEVDPFVMLTNQKMFGGVDAYERNRVVASLAMMVRDGQITQEQMIDASRTEDGDIWNMAIQMSAEKRFSGDIASFMIGVGARPRTQEDMIINKFWGDYSTLLASKSMMTSDQYREAWEKLRENPDYGMFVDGLLLGRKTGQDQQAAFSYNVLSRIPPGSMTDVAEYVGLESYMINAFYENKGDLSSLTPQDRARFQAAMVDLSVMLQLPSGATREEWSAARSTYSAMNESIKQEFGSDILDKIDRFYSMDSDEKERFLEAYPEVEIALQAQTAYVANTPILAAYYGGLETVTRYYNNNVYKDLEAQFGKDVEDILDQYYMLKDNLMTAEAKAFERQNNIKAILAEKKRLQEEANKQIISAASQIPEGKDYTIRPDFMPQGGIQEDVLDYVTTNQQSQVAEEIWSQLSPASQELLQDYFNGEDLPSAVERQVDYIARQYGMSQSEALRLLGVEIGN